MSKNTTSKKGRLARLVTPCIGTDEGEIYEGNSISKLQIQVATYVFELSAGNCHR